MNIYLMLALMVTAAAIQPAVAEPIVELRTNAACAAAFYQTIHELRAFTEVGRRLVPGNPPTTESCRNARHTIELARAHLRLNIRMYAVCHQDGSAALSLEAARNAHLEQSIIPRYCR